MSPPGAWGRATWVLFWGLLASALALGCRCWSSASRGPLQCPLHAQPSSDPLSAAGDPPGLDTPPRLSRTRPKRTRQDLLYMIWPNRESSHLTTVVEASLGTQFNKEIEVFNPLPTSAASSGLWTHSLFAFIPSWPKKTLFKRESPATQHLYGDISRELRGTSENGVIFQKCALVSGQSASQTAHVQLLVNNTKTPLSANLSDLLLLDNITGLTIRASVGNKTSEGLQTFRKKFLQVGDFYLVSYTASLQTRDGDIRNGDSLMLPAQLTFQSLSLNRTQLKALFTITTEEKVMGFVLRYPQELCGCHVCQAQCKIPGSHGVWGFRSPVTTPSSPSH